MQLEPSLAHRSAKGFLPVPQHLKPQLIPVAQKVFWWGNPEVWLQDSTRFVAQVMTYGDWTDTCTTLKLLGDSIFRGVLESPPPGVFDIKSWNYWRHYYHLEVIPLPQRNLQAHVISLPNVPQHLLFI